MLTIWNGFEASPLGPKGDAVPRPRSALRRKGARDASGDRGRDGQLLLAEEALEVDEAIGVFHQQL